MQGLVGAGIGYAVVPLLGVGESAEVAVLGVAGVPPRLITIAWHADRVPTPGGAGVRRDRDRDRGRDRRGLRSRGERPHPDAREATPVRLLTVVGNRPQFIKSAPLSLALRDAGIEEIVVHTGQHWDPALSAVFFEELGLRRAGRRRSTCAPRTSRRSRRRCATAIAGAAPDAVLVYGDTNSTLAGARAGAGLPVAHVEAGLRSGDLTMPEERNRIEVDGVSALPVRARRALRRDPAGRGRRGRDPRRRRRDGRRRRTVRAPRARALAHPRRRSAWSRTPTSSRPSTARPTCGPTGCAASSRASGARRCPVVLPAHPRTRATSSPSTAIPLPPSLTLIEPLGYLDFAALASQAAVIATDSGGLQKEAYWYGVPCVTMRPSTEWVDTVEAGANVLVDDDPERIAAALADGRDARRPARALRRRPRLRADRGRSRRYDGALCIVTSQSSAPATSACRSPRSSPTRGAPSCSSTSAPSASRS